MFWFFIFIVAATLGAVITAGALAPQQEFRDSGHRCDSRARAPCHRHRIPLEAGHRRSRHCGRLLIGGGGDVPKGRSIEGYRRGTRRIRTDIRIFLADAASDRSSFVRSGEPSLYLWRISGRSWDITG